MLCFVKSNGYLEIVKWYEEKRKKATFSGWKVVYMTK